MDGDTASRRALETILGEDALRAGVDHYVAMRPGHELVRSVLWLLRPWSAAAYCHEIATTANDILARRTAIHLLRAVADRRALPWVSEFLDDPDPEVQSLGLGVLEQLLWSDRIEPEEAGELLERAECHENEAVRERAAIIRGFLRDWAEISKT